MINGKYKKHYALYKGDNYIDSGTLLQLAIKRNVKLRTMQFYITPTYLKRIKSNGNNIKLIAID